MKMVDQVNLFGFDDNQVISPSVQENCNHNLGGLVKKQWKSEFKQLTEERQRETYFGNLAPDTEEICAPPLDFLDYDIIQTDNPVQCLPVQSNKIDYEEIASKIEDFSLNAKQKVVFQSMIKNTVRRLQGEPVDQIIAYVGGAGGTGKSQVIKAVVEFFTFVKERHALRLCAYTGTAAKLIGGTTITLLAMLHQNASVSKLERVWSKTTTVLEVSI